jgi:hypothetical protein
MTAPFDESKDRGKVKRLETAFLTLAADPKIYRSFPSIAKAADTLTQAKANDREDEIETRLLELYCELHHAGSEYQRSERIVLDNKDGYFNHPGGISPLLKAEKYIGPESHVADLGAGNGLQGLLFQFLYPHKVTIQVELSSEMINVGKIFQRILGISEENVVWINDDIMNVSLEEVDFLYLYRPSKPTRSGVKLYESLVDKLSTRKRSITIFSIADCLRDFLDKSFVEFYSDGHLTCFEKRIPRLQTSV